MNYTGFSEAAMEEIAEAKYIAEIDAMDDEQFFDYLSENLGYWDDGEEESGMDFSESPKFGIKVRAVRR